MARTYRKNLRHYMKYGGEFYNPHKDRTVKGKARAYNSYSWRNDDAIWGADYFREIVFVGDSENYGTGTPPGHKKMCHRIDRARFRNALIHNEDAYIKSSLDPWDWT